MQPLTVLAGILGATVLASVLVPRQVDSRVCFGSMKTVVCVPPGDQGPPPSPAPGV